VKNAMLAYINHLIIVCKFFLALLFSDESSTIALDIMDSLIVVNEVQKAVHLYLDHVEPWYILI